ncbi:MAG: hypothetical protein QOG71_3909 [Pyrinomonadaceae bacterium]|nr:hypothetical protein [Pyrinomonadaceae bacterium]
MVKPVMNLAEGELEQWIQVCEELTYFQNLALLGLLSLKADTPLSIIKAIDPNSSENVSAAERWLKKNLRSLLQFYCVAYVKKSVRVTGIAIDKAEVVKNLAPVAVATLSIPVGFVVAFLFAALGLVLDNWCQRYAKQRYAGEGTYEGNFEQKQVAAFFEITHTPAIIEEVENPAAFPLKVRMLAIKVPAEISGMVKVPSPADSSEIFHSFQARYSHRFTFVDVTQSKKIKGAVESVYQDIQEGPNVLGVTSNELNVETDYKRTDSLQSELTRRAVQPEEITYHAVEKDGQVTAIWEMQGRKHLRTIDPRSRQGQEILRLYTPEE